MRSLVWVVIHECSLLKDLTWTIELPSLQHLHVVCCGGVTTVVVGNDEAKEIKHTGAKQDKEDHHKCYFPKLVGLILKNLDSLESLSSTMLPLLFPSLKRLHVEKCPKLENLCLGANSAKNIEEIKGKQEWWNRLKWEDADTKSLGKK